MKECRFYAGDKNKASRAAADYISAIPYWINAAKKCNIELYNTLRNTQAVPERVGKTLERILLTTPHICTTSFVYEGKDRVINVDLLDWSVTVV